MPSVAGRPPGPGGRLPPGRYDGTTSAVDGGFNSFVETRRLDLEPDDDLTVDFGAPTLLAVRPIPGAAGGSATVTGTVSTSDASVTSLQVFVNGAATPVGGGGSFSATATIGTGPLTVVARDNFGRATTLKRYFTTMAGLFAPADGADLVSQGLDVNSIQTFTFLAPTPKHTFNAGRTIPLKLTGALGGAAVTSANAATAPQIIAVLQVVAGGGARLQPLGLSREQRDRVLLILGAQALHPAQESPTLQALRAAGQSRVLSDAEAKRVRDERQQISERTLRALRPALTAVLTPEQLAQVGLGGDAPAAASDHDHR